MLPTSLLPEAAEKVSQIIPSTHAMNAFSGLAMGGEALFDPWGSILVLLLSGVIAFGLAIYMFSWDSNNRNQRGHPVLAALVLLPFVVGIFLF